MWSVRIKTQHNATERRCKTGRSKSPTWLGGKKSNYSCSSLFTVCRSTCVPCSGVAGGAVVGGCTYVFLALCARRAHTRAKSVCTCACVCVRGCAQHNLNMPKQGMGWGHQASSARRRKVATNSHHLHQIRKKKNCSLQQVWWQVAAGNKTGCIYGDTLVPFETNASQPERTRTRQDTCQSARRSE